MLTWSDEQIRERLCAAEIAGEDMEQVELDIQLLASQLQDECDWFPSSSANYETVWTDAVWEISGVYQILNAINRKRYVGSTVCLGARWKEHKNKLLANSHYNIHLQRSWNKFGFRAFKFMLLEACEPEDLVSREQFWIDGLMVAVGNDGYNINPIAGSCRGCTRVFSDSHRANLSKASRGKKKGPLSEEHRRKISVAFKGRAFSDSHRANLSAAQLGRKLTDDEMRRMRLTKRAKAGITEEQRAEMRRLYEIRHRYRLSKRRYTVVQLAKMFGVSSSVAYNNVNGRDPP